MNDLIETIGALPDHYKLLWLALCLGGATLLERLRPGVGRPAGRWPHVRTNLGLLLVVFVINAAFAALLLAVLPPLQAAGFGVLQWMQGPVWVELLLTIVVLDLVAQYTMHYLLHNVPLLWRFHMVHHSDTHVDATTGTRHHPVDYLARETMSLVAVVLLGAPLSYYLIYRLLTVFFTYFTHADLALPPALDATLSRVIVTPTAHKFHHHESHPWTDRNYGNILSVWDRLFGTFVYDDPARIRYGVDTMPPARAGHFGYQLVRPFAREAGRPRGAAPTAAIVPPGPLAAGKDTPGPGT